MLGIIVQLFISWLIIWLFDKSNLSVLGFRPTTDRLFSLLIQDGQFLTNSCLIFFAVTFLPMTGMLLVNYFLLRKRKQVIIEI